MTAHLRSCMHCVMDEARYCILLERECRSLLKKGSGTMTYRKLLLILAAGALLLTLLLLKFVPWEALITLLFLLGIMVSPVISQLLQIAKARQEQPPASSTSWSSYRTWGNDQPKQDPPGAWDQPQVATPEQAPPPIQ